MVGCSSPAGCHPQAPVLLLPPGLWLAQQLARPSLTTAVQRALLRSKAPGCQSSWLLFAPVLGQMALKQLIFKRGFIAKSQSSLQAGAKVLPFLWLRQLLLGESSTFRLLASSLPSCHKCNLVARPEAQPHAPARHAHRVARHKKAALMQPEIRCLRGETKKCVVAGRTLKMGGAAGGQSKGLRGQDPISDCDQHCHLQRSI